MKKKKHKIVYEGSNLKLSDSDRQKKGKQKLLQTYLDSYFFISPLSFRKFVLLFFFKGFLCVCGAKLIQSIFRFIFEFKVVDSSARKTLKTLFKAIYILTAFASELL